MRQQELDDRQMPAPRSDLQRRIVVAPVLDKIDRHPAIQKSFDSRKVAIRRTLRNPADYPKAHRRRIVSGLQSGTIDK